MKNQKIDSLQALRAIAFGAIFIHHCGLKFGGGWGVSVFLILSGFLLVYNHRDDVNESVKGIEGGLPEKVKKSLLFSWQRIKKLYPLHIIMTITAIPFMLHALSSYSGTDKLWRVGFLSFANVALIQSWFPPEWIRYSMNNLSWYLCVCVSIYASFPWINKRVCRRTAGDCIKMLVILNVVQFAIGEGINLLLTQTGTEPEIVQGLTYNFPLYRLFDFAIGCNLGKLFLCMRTEMAAKEEVSQNKQQRSWKTFTAIEALLIISVLITAVLNLILWDSNTLRAFRLVCMNTPTAMLAVWLFARNGGVFRRYVQIDYSYGLAI